jgi:WD40 repeat protein
MKMRASWLRSACTLALFAVGAALAAGAPPKDPVLRIETGNHLAPITRISTDATGHWLVTASEDKTARLWDAQSGQALSVLRPPVGAGALGAVYAASISPDGRTVALGGNTDFDGSSSHLLHLFDRASASILPKSTVPGIEAPITQLAWSRDSQLLAVGLRQQGLRVFRRNLQLLGGDSEYNEAIFGAEFSADGKLAVASLDGAIRIYQTGPKGLTRVARKTASDGKPYAVSFSADGRTLAVGYQDQARVDLLDSSTLAVLSSVQLKGGNLGRVVWSADGSTLFAAGSYATGGRFPVLAIDQGGRGTPREVGQFSNTVMALAALPDGSVAAASAEPAWAVFDVQGKTRVSVRPQSADFRDADASFKLSPAADVLSFRFAPNAETLVFDLTGSSLKSGPPPAQTLSPRMRGDSNDWKNRPTPRLGGRNLKILPGELARSLALSKDERSLVLGSDWFVRQYNLDGVLLWERRMPAAAWAVNISEDGRWVVAGLGDGSIRWLRLMDGMEELALFVHADRSRWIAWTPSGYYDTSVGGEGLIGWHLNRAFNQSADFFTAGRFRDKLYRPDVVAKMLFAGDELEALRLTMPPPVVTAAATLAPAAARAQAPTPVAVKPEPVKVVAEQLPPVVELRSDAIVQTSAKTLPLQFETRSPPGAPVTMLKTRVNGKLTRSVSGKSLRGIGVQQIDVPLPEGDGEVQVFAENKFGKSEPVTVKVVRSDDGGKKPPVEKYEKLYLLVVGVSKYPGDFELEFPAKDATDFNSYMMKQKGRLYDEVVSRVLLDQEASRVGVIDGLKWLRDTVGEHDAGVVFFAGHGDNVDKTYYFIPGDPGALPAAGVIKSAKQMDTWKHDNGPSNWVSGDEITKTLLGLKGRAAFFIDTCHAGQVVRGNGSLTGALNEIDEEKGVIVFASSTGKETSQEDAKWGNGAFTKAILEGIGGKADKDSSGLIRPTYLSAYVNDRVRSLTGNEQRPVTLTVGIDDPIAVKTR